ncbi:mCG1031593, partial [Mus musculus]
FHSNKFIFSISSYGITTQIKLQSNDHIKRYPYYLTTVHIFISF